MREATKEDVIKLARLVVEHWESIDARVQEFCDNFGASDEACEAMRKTTLVELGFKVEQTGGNCWALVLRTPFAAPSGELWQIWATDGNLGVPFNPDGHPTGGPVDIGWYAGDEAPYTGHGEEESYATEIEAVRAVARWLAHMKKRSER